MAEYAIILMTGHGEEALANRGRQGGRLIFIQKPIERMLLSSPFAA